MATRVLIQYCILGSLLLYLNSNNVCMAATSEAEAQVVLEVPAMGRMAQLGELYDATDETFLNQLIFAKRVPDDTNLITTVDNPKTETKFQVVESMSQKLTFLGIAASIAVSLKVGSFAIELTGAASYVKDEKHSQKYVEGFLVHKTETSRDSVDLFYEGIRPYVDVNTLMETTATHVVTGIYNGADVVAQFIDKNQLDEDRMDIKGRLEIAFSMQAIQVSGSAQVNITDGVFTNSSSYELKVSGDVPMKTIPQNSYEVLEFIKLIPSELKEINDGKGKPIRYVLTPLHHLQKVYEMEHMKAKMVEAIDEAILSEVLQTFEEIGKTRQKLNDLQDLFDAYVHSCMTPTIKRTLDELSNFFDATAGQFTADVRNGLVGVRNNTIEMSEIQVIINNYNSHTNSTGRVNLRLEHDFEDGKRKIQFYEAFMKHMEPSQYMTESTYEADLIKTDDHVFYVLFYNLTLVDQDIKAWEDGTYLFFNELKRVWSKLKVVDCDFALQNAHCSTLKTTKIYSYISNRRVSSDVLADYNSYRDYSPLRIPAVQVKDHDKAYEIGHLFNITTRRFIEASILNRKNSLDPQTTDPTKKIKCEIFPHSNETMFKALSIPPEKQIPILLQPEKLNGTSRIFSNVRWDPTKEVMNLVCICTSKKVWIDTMSISKGFFDSLDLLSLVDRHEASHFVQATELNLNGIISLETANKEPGVREKLRSKLEVVKSALEVKTEGESIFTDPDFTGITIRMFTDIKNNPQPNVKNLTDIVNQFSTLQQSSSLENHGSPVYTLYPIPTLQTQYGLITEPRHINTTDIFPGLSTFAGYFDKFQPLLHNITTKTLPFIPYDECIPEDVRNQIGNLSASFKETLNASKVTLQNAFDLYLEQESYRGLEQSLADLSKLTVQGELTQEELLGLAQSYSEKMTFYDLLVNKGRFTNETYITKPQQIESAISKSSELPVYLFFFHLNWIKTFQQAWTENISVFFGLFVQDEFKGYVVDCEYFANDLCNVSQPVIQEYNNSKLTYADVVFRMKSEEKVNETAEDRLEHDLNEHVDYLDNRLTEITWNISDLVTTMEHFSSATRLLINEFEAEMRAAAGSPPPINAVYVQYNSQAPPTQLWTGTLWQDKTSAVPDVFGNVFVRYR